MESKKAPKQTGNIKLNTMVIVLLWTLLVAFSLAWNIHHQRKELPINAHFQADAYIN